MKPDPVKPSFAALLNARNLLGGSLPQRAVRLLVAASLLFYGAGATIWLRAGHAKAEKPADPASFEADPGGKGYSAIGHSAVDPSPSGPSTGDHPAQGHSGASPATAGHSAAPLPGKGAEGLGTEGDRPLPPRLPDPDAEAHLKLAEIYRSQGRSAEALPHIERIYEKNRDDSNFIAMAAELFLGAGHYRQALRAGREGLGYFPRGDRLLAVEAMALFRLGREEDGLARAERGADLFGKSLPLLTALATMRFEVDPRDERAERLLDSAIALDPLYVPARYQRGRLRQLEGDYRDAEADFRAVLQRDPGFAKAHGQLGLALFRLQRFPEADAAFGEALKRNPEDFNTRYNRAELHLLSSFDAADSASARAFRMQALRGYLKALETRPNHAPSLYRLGLLQNGNGQHKEALRNFEAAVEAQPDHVESYVQMAVAYRALGRAAEARENLARALELDPLHQVAQFLSQQSPFLSRHRAP